MDLKEYLTVTKQSLRSFAKICGVSPATMMRVSKKSVVPSRRLMERIYEETDQLVAPCDLVGLSCVSKSQKVSHLHVADVDVPINASDLKANG